MFEYFRFRYRRAIRRARRRIGTYRRRVRNYSERHILGKGQQFKLVQRFLIVWWTVAMVGIIGLVGQITALEHQSRRAQPVAGGTFSEAAVGTVTVLNPILPDATADDVNRLIYSGLTRYDEKGKLVGDLADHWDISPDGHTYTFHLRPGVSWHDGVPFTSGDVMFTIAAIQNPDSRSPLASSWRSIKTTAPDDLTIAMELPTPLASFLDSTTLGIAPRHLLESVDPAQLREAAFNQKPVGTGPFAIKTFAPSANEITLAANPRFYRGRPKLDDFTFRYYTSPAEALTAYERHQVTSPGRIGPVTNDRAAKIAGLTTLDFSLPEQTTLFFNLSDSLLKDHGLREIIDRALNRQAILQAAEAGEGRPLGEPLLPGQTGYTTKYEPGATTVQAAEQALETAGWQKDKDGIRSKDGRRLQFDLVTLEGGALARAAGQVKVQLEAMGIGVQTHFVALDDLQQSYIRPRHFQMLLYGVNVGADPDVYAFWHSSQTKDPGLNLSGYSSADADRALESGRINTDALVRQGKYEAFLKAWNADLPAAVLYQPTYRYAVDVAVTGIVPHRLITPADRFANVIDWTVKTKQVPKYR